MWTNQGRTILPYGRPRKPPGAGSRLRRPVRGPGCGMVNEFPLRRQVRATAPAGRSPPQLDTKARRPGGTRKRPLRDLHENSHINSQTLNSQTPPLSHSYFVLGRRPLRVPQSGVSCPTEAAAMPRIARARDGGGHACMRRRSPWPVRLPTAARRDGGFRGRA